MDGRKVFAKTQKGKDEIATRQYRLPAKLRMALILVDGKSDMANLAGEGESGLAKELEELALLGFIEEVSPSFEKSAPASSKAAASSAAGIKTELIRITSDILGSQADKIIKKIEKSPDDKEGLGATLNSCIEVVRLIVDEKKSRTLETKFGEALSKI